MALNAVAVSFAKELEPLGIKVNAVKPGHVRTDLNAVMTTGRISQAFAWINMALGTDLYVQ